MSTFGSFKSLKVGIVGFGSFAQFLAETIIKQGHTLRATSRSDYSQLCAQLGITFFRDVGELLLADNDVILLCTSILSLAQVLKSMPFYKMVRLDTLFVDVLSVKEYPRDLLLEVLPKESDILCTHPMFGPQSGKNGWDTFTFVYDRVRIINTTRCSNFLQNFESQGCKMVEMSCEEHDKMAAKSQFISHAIGRILSEMEVESTPIDTKGFETLVQLKKSTMSDSYDLFSGLFVHNKYARGELKNLELAFGRVNQSLFERMDETTGIQSDQTNQQKEVSTFSNASRLKHGDSQKADVEEQNDVANIINYTHENSVLYQNSRKKQLIKTQMQLTSNPPCTRNHAMPQLRRATKHATRSLNISLVASDEGSRLAYRPI